MTRRTKIVVVGIGGVGGYFGGLLAKRYQDSTTVEVVFVARGEHLKQIQANGLQVIHGELTFTAYPTLATDDVDAIGKADYILLCTKSYDLEASIEQIKTCIANHTVILPLLNGVDSTDRTKRLLPHAMVLQGCVYIVSRLKKAGVVENKGHLQTLYFGGQLVENEELQLLHDIMKDAGIEATLSTNIATTIWEKFIFISPIATATSYFDSTVGKLVTDHGDAVKQLVREVLHLAAAKHIPVAADMEARVWNRLMSLPYETTSSMHSDYQSGKGKTEVHSLTGYVVKEGQQLNVPTPTYALMYEQLLKRTIKD